MFRELLSKFLTVIALKFYCSFRNLTASRPNLNYFFMYVLYLAQVVLVPLLHKKLTYLHYLLLSSKVYKYFNYKDANSLATSPWSTKRLLLGYYILIRIYNL